MSVVVVGSSSFLAHALAQEPACGDWIFLSHRDALDDTGWAQGTSAVLNFAFEPAFKTEGYDVARDVDSALARLIAPYGGRYIMMSSRTVYGPGDGSRAFAETDPARPVTPYAMAKYAAEQALPGILGADRVTILRLSNIFGHEYGRTSFFGLALGGLRDKGKITFDMSAAVKRDFYASWRFARALAAIAQNPQPGLFNLGAGFGTECGQVAQWLIDGYGGGTIEVIDDALKDSFWLDMGKTLDVYGIEVYDPEKQKQDCMSCGAHLKTIV